MTNTRHPDLEIYIKNRSVAEIQAWLAQHASELSLVSTKGLIHTYKLEVGDACSEVLIHEKVAGKAWVSLWFKENITPWPQDLDCAHVAAKEMDTQIRCIASGWDDGDDPDEFWKVENGEQEKIQWRT